MSDGPTREEISERHEAFLEALREDGYGVMMGPDALMTLIEFEVEQEEGNHGEGEEAQDVQGAHREPPEEGGGA